MAFDQTTRNRLSRFVSDARALLTDEFTRQLQNDYGLDPASGAVADLSSFGHLEDARRETARILRDTMAHYAAGSAFTGKRSRQDALDRIVREQAFTLLNRLCALRMAEARGLLIESVARGHQSRGFSLYARLAGTALGETGDAYRVYLLSVFDEFAVDLPALFDRFSPQGRLFPRETALLQVLEMVNHPDLEALWPEDETIGWVYQYYNSSDERRQMRSESRAPRNSREMAVRNQFFTPRYVVEFLTDNTLGRVWYEMTRGETSLAEECRYLVRRKRPVFLEPGEEPPAPFFGDVQGSPDLPGEMWVRPNPEWTGLYDIWVYALTVGAYHYAKEQLGIECGDLANARREAYAGTGRWEGTFEELRCCLFFEQRRYHHFGVDPEGEDLDAIWALHQAICERWDIETEHIAHRPLKDPRDITMLDPACGSMHFGLYAFDLYERIYEEAWDLEGALGTDAFDRPRDLKPLRETYVCKEDLLRDVPRLIIERNIHGIDIDPRAVQIAGLSLWLRAQRSWQAQGLRASERPRILRANIVCAEPMPGEQEILNEFLSDLQPPVLGQIVRAICDRMALAGEAGSLLRIEANLAGVLAAAHEEWKTATRPGRDRRGNVLLFTEGQLDALSREPNQGQFDLSGVSAPEFWQEAESRVLVALRDYTEQAENGTRTQRLLFAADATQGFSYIDVCRRRYDVVLMNPPFGALSRGSKSYIEGEYHRSTGDVLAHFVERALQLSLPNGLVGAISSRTAFFLSSLASFREEVLRTDGRLTTMADLGDGVLDAMVETAMYVVARAPDRRSQAVFVRVLLDDDKEGAVQDSIIDLAHGVLQDRVFLMEPEGFLRLANSPYCYWVGSATVAELARHPHLEGNAGVVRVGLQTGDDWRFLRLLWEVPTESMVMDGRAGGTWYPFSKTDAAAPWVSPIVLVVKWKHAGREIMSFCDSQGKLRSRPQNLEFYFQPGFSYMLRSTRLVPYIVPTGVIPTAGRAQVYPAEGMEYPLLGLCASNLASAVARFSGEKFAWPKFQASMVQNLPIAHLSASLVAQLTSRIEHEVAARHAALSGYEPHQEFIRPAVLAQQDQDVSGEWDLTSLLGDDLERAIAGSFGLTDRQLRELERDIREAIAVRQSPPAEDADEPESDMPAVAMSLVDDSPRAREEGLVSYCVGIAFGRWDVRIGRDHTLAPPARDAFAPLPVCPPGALVSTDGLPAFMNNIASKGSLRAGTDGSPRGPVASDRQVAPVEEDYPFRVSWTGILASDPGQAEDVVQRAREALAVLCPQDAEEVEQRICATLDVTTLDDYISKPSSFFADHLNRYTGGRRQAPIYWPVSTSSGSYTLWLYYHRLTDQTLYTCVNDFVDPKLRQVGDRLAGLQAKAGRSAADEQELARLADLEVELTDLRDELLRVARFWRPNLNDGVEITAAPLWRLFRHRPWQKRLQGTWEKLEAGEYDWAHLAVSIWPERVVRASLRDRSYAIAHDLEGTLWEEAEVTKRSRGGKETVSREWRPRDLSEEQLDPIVARVKARR